MEHLISIIVPIYNASKCLDKCITSITKQDYSNIEIILVNDGSTDNSKDVCDKYGRLDKRIKVLSKDNGGVSSARNMGLDNACGEYIMFVDADDYIEKNMVSLLYNELQQNGASMSIIGMNVSTLKSEIIVDYKEFDKVIDSRGEYIIALQRNWGPYCKLFDKKLIENVRFNTDYAIAEDLLFNTEVICKNDNFKIAVSKGAAYNYLELIGSAMNSEYSEKFLNGLECEEKVYEMFKSIERQDMLYDVIFKGVLVFFFRYSIASDADREIFAEHLNKAIEIIKRNKKYLLKGWNRRLSDRLKMSIIVHFPKLYVKIRNSAEIKTC